MKLISWNVNGIRAIAQKNFFEAVDQIAPEILCLQETKAQDEQVAEVLSSLEGYEVFASSAEKKGYSGTAILSRQRPVRVLKGIGIPEHDTEGRVMVLEFESWNLVNVYVPNSGNDLKRLNYRQNWDQAFFSYLKTLENHKPVLVCGDFNVAHRDIDLARPKANFNKSAGYMQEEIDGMDRYTGGGFTDTFRHAHPEATEAYSWWSYRAGARARNIGWRIDYFLAGHAILPLIREAYILSEVMGSDHCPIGVDLDL
jgi:exodeoxyribonuclease-3